MSFAPPWEVGRYCWSYFSCCCRAVNCPGFVGVRVRGWCWLSRSSGCGSFPCWLARLPIIGRPVTVSDQGSFAQVLFLVFLVLCVPASWLQVRFSFGRTPWSPVCPLRVWCCGGCTPGYLGFQLWDGLHDNWSEWLVSECWLRCYLMVMSHKVPSGSLSLDSGGTAINLAPLVVV